jgi:hypothetical protein
LRRFTIGRLMGVVAAVGVGLWLLPRLGVVLGNALVALAAAVGAIRVVATHPEGSRLRRGTVALVRAALAVDLPCLLGPFLVRDCDHCVGVWLMLWPVAFGLMGFHFLAAFLRLDVGWAREDRLEFTLGGILTAAFIALIAGLGVRGRGLRIGSLVAAASLSLFFVWGISALIRA